MDMLTEIATNITPIHPSDRSANESANAGDVAVVVMTVVKRMTKW